MFFLHNYVLMILQKATKIIRLQINPQGLAPTVKYATQLGLAPIIKYAARLIYNTERVMPDLGVFRCKTHFVFK